MNLHQILDKAAVVFGDEETDILTAWNDDIGFEAFAGKFNGYYDNVDGFHREVKTLGAAKEAARM